METFEERVRRGGSTAIAEAERFFMETGAVHQALRRITAKLTALEIPHAVCGGMAINAHGHFRTTVDVDILVTTQGLARIHAELEGLGYVPPFQGSKNLRDVETAVRIEFLIAGQFPGDGKPKPIAFPDPVEAAVEIDGIHYLRLTTLIELKLASGMTGPGRHKDLGDVEALISQLKLPLAFAAQLNPYVQAKYQELWHGVQEANELKEQ